MSRHHRRKQRLKLRSFYLWHRYMGISAAVLVLVIAVTGVLLNHTEDFQFDSEHIRSTWILDWYGIRAPETMHTFLADDGFITLMGRHLYLNRREIEGTYSQLIGAVKSRDMFVVATGASILLLTQRGELVERLQAGEGVPAGIRAIGSDAEGRVILQTSHAHYQPDEDFISWKRLDTGLDRIVWAAPTALEPRLKTALQRHFRLETLPVERVILDLHSGRFFGRLGPWLFDAAAFLFILLALSGCWIWLQRRR